MRCQEISLTGSRPSMPSSTSRNAPKLSTRATRPVTCVPTAYLVGGVEPRVGHRLLEAQAELAGFRSILRIFTSTTSPTLTTSAGVLDAAVAHLADVEQAVHAAEVDERAEVHDAADGAAADLALGQFAPSSSAGLFLLALEDVAAADDQVLLLAVELRDLDGHALADEDARCPCGSRCRPGRRA